MNKRHQATNPRHFSSRPPEGKNCHRGAFDRILPFCLAAIVAFTGIRLYQHAWLATPSCICLLTLLVGASCLRLVSVALTRIFKPTPNHAKPSVHRPLYMIALLWLSPIPIVLVWLIATTLWCTVNRIDSGLLYSFTLKIGSLFVLLCWLLIVYESRCLTKRETVVFSGALVVIQLVANTPQPWIPEVTSAWMRFIATMGNASAIVAVTKLFGVLESWPSNC